MFPAREMESTKAGQLPSLRASFKRTRFQIHVSVQLRIDSNIGL